MIAIEFSKSNYSANTCYKILHKEKNAYILCLKLIASMKYDPILNFIDGEFVAPQTNRFLHVISPIDGEVLSTVPMSGKGDLDFAIAAAKSASVSSGISVIAVFHVFIIHALLPRGSPSGADNADDVVISFGH